MPNQSFARQSTPPLGSGLMLPLIFWLTTLCLPALASTANPAPIQTETLPMDTMAADTPLPELNSCLARLATTASASGITDTTFKQVFDGISYDPKVIEYDRRQPEFSESFASYFNKRVNSWRIEHGQRLLKEHHDLLIKLQKKYGIPSQYIVSFWGLETNFGRNKGKMSVIRSLFTLACDYRRSEFFTTELIHALKLVQDYQLDSQIMLGSWAGAMGHTQFMPSAYRQYAIDGDHDSKVDLFNSIPDALSSAANFLHHLGWQTGFRWGREVGVPADFGYQHSGAENAMDLSQWRKLGLTLTTGKPLPKGVTKAALLVPSGHKGPAFLIYDNFEVIMRWNRSEYYALAVGHLADRIAGAGPLHRPAPDSINLTKYQVLTLQQKLNALGHEVGKADGIMGPATAKGIRQFQLANNMIADGFADAAVFSQLNIAMDNPAID